MKVIELVYAKDASLKEGDVALRYSKVDFTRMGVRVYNDGDLWLTPKLGVTTDVDTGKLYCITHEGRWLFRIKGKLDVLWLKTVDVLDTLGIVEHPNPAVFLELIDHAYVKQVLWDSHMQSQPVETQMSIADMLDIYMPKKKVISWTLSKDGVTYGGV